MRVSFIGWKFWAVVAALVAVYAGLGFKYSGSNRVEGDLFGASHVYALVAPVVFILVYTVMGLRGPAKWWRNELGTALVLAFASGIPSAAVFVYISYFHNFQLDQALPDWVYSSSPLLSGSALLWLSYVWLKQAPQRVQAGTKIGVRDRARFMGFHRRDRSVPK